MEHASDKEDEGEKKDELNGMNGKNNTNNKMKTELPEKLDELSSLEQEIAMMHSSTKATVVIAEKLYSKTITSSRRTSGLSGGIVLDESKLDKSHVALTPEQAMEVNAAFLDEIDVDADGAEKFVREEECGESVLEDVDLIAVLKGTDSVQDLQDLNGKKGHVTTDCSELDVGVTIEGEGEFEIMDIVDDDQEPVHSRDSTPTTQQQQHRPPINMLNKAYSKTKMSPAEERAVAMEQIANLRSNNSRRKQEIKPTFLNTISDDWNEYDGESDSLPLVASQVGLSNQIVVDSKSKSGKNPKEMPKLVPANAPSVTKVALAKNDMKTQTLTTKSKDMKEMPKLLPASTPSVTKVSVIKNEVKINTSLTSTETSNVDIAVSPNASTISEEQLLESSSGFKRKRVIKRKIIWDPDVPDTSKSYSQYAAPTRNTPTPKLASPTSTATVTSQPSSPISVKKEVAVPKQQKARSATPKDQEPVADEVSSNRSPTPAVLKGRSQTPSLLANGGPSAIKKKKISSELDRLMGDEGAVSMILDVEHKRRTEQVAATSDETQTHRPVMRNRAYTICEKHAKLGAAIKKESSPPKTKRSVSGKARASDTWNYVYQQRQNDDSMIIRRRSSSYSSTASLRRLSIDKQANVSDNETPSSSKTTAATTSKTAFKFVKPEIKLSSGPFIKLVNSIASDMKSGIRASPTISGTGKSNCNETVSIRKFDKVAQVIVNVSRARLPFTYGVQLLNKLVEVLNNIIKSNECNTVVICGTGGQFCHGIDFLDLSIGSVEKRRNNAAQLATALKTYLKTLINYPKPIILALNGNVKNFGLMQLPCFDYVVGSERCSFEANYIKIGQLPEGNCFWQEPIKRTALWKLLLLGKRSTLAEFDSFSELVQKRTAPGKVIEEALAVAKIISANVPPAENFYKNTRQYFHAKNVDALKSLDEEFKVITDQWTSNYMFEMFKNYSELGHF